VGISYKGLGWGLWC